MTACVAVEHEEKMTAPEVEQATREWAAWLDEHVPGWKTPKPAAPAGKALN